MSIHKVPGRISARFSLLLPYRTYLLERLPVCVLFLLGFLALSGRQAQAADIFIRFKVLEPQGERIRVTAGGWRHSDPWYLPAASAEVAAGAWSEWIDISQWPWHGRMKRAGGIAEWPAMKLSVARVGSPDPIKGCRLEVQLADKADEGHVVITFEEKSESETIGFLVPNPLREHAKEFETGSQMTARHLAWAKAASGNRIPQIKHFDIITSLWGHYDPALARQELETLRLLGFNVVGGVDTAMLQKAGLRTYGHTWAYSPDPAATEKQWAGEAAGIKKAMETETGRWQYGNTAHWVLSDEVSALDFRSTDATRLNGWFRQYLSTQGVTAQDLGKPLDEVTYPAEAMFQPTLPREADLPTRKLMYHAAKFGQWWSAKALRHTGTLVKSTLPGMKTETLLPSHGFFGHAWSPAHIGMSYRMLDFFELGAQQSVDQLSSEDWLGLNHMYGPGYTWTGGQTFGYFTALLRSSALLAPARQPMSVRGLITVSDDKYLRLKAYSGLAQGAKSFFFWTFGPTYIGTENYWSDLRSMYDGIAKVSQAIEKAEPVLAEAQPVRDPVAILYSVSHDLWHTDNPAAFVEKRLLWHALRHLQVQPDFVREEDMTAERLKNYKVLYITDWCVSRKASAAIDKWVRNGGVLYLSAGAATRDEFYEPYVPPFATRIWPDDAAQQLKTEKHRYNERSDLPSIKPMAMVKVHHGKKGSRMANYVEFDLPVLGARLNLHPDGHKLDQLVTAIDRFATFDDGAPAGKTVRYGRGLVMGLGFMPMLAYGQGAGFKPTALEEKWPWEPRFLIQRPLFAANVVPAAGASVPVVETSLLTGPKGSAVILANYTYQPLKSVTVKLKLPGRITRAVSTEGSPVRLRRSGENVHFDVPLDATDIVLLTAK